MSLTTINYRTTKVKEQTRIEEVLVTALVKDVYLFNGDVFLTTLTINFVLLWRNVLIITCLGLNVKEEKFLKKFSVSAFSFL
jgi:hypothetical protein